MIQKKKKRQKNPFVISKEEVQKARASVGHEKWTVGRPKGRFRREALFSDFREDFFSGDGM